MVMDVSRLGIEVQSTGIKEASAGLSGLGTSAANAERRVRKLTDTVDKLIGSMTNLAKLQGTATQAAASHIQAIQGGVNAMKGMQASAIGTTKSLQQLQQQATQTGNAFGHAHSKAGIFNNTLKSMTVAASAYLGINFVRGIVDAGDAWQMMTAKLKMATGSMENAKIVQENLFDLAQSIRVPLNDIGKLYTRMAVPLAELGKTSKDTMDMVKGVSLALQLGGATAAEASSAILQFSQSINAGRLNGAEFNSVSESAPILIRAIRDELERTEKKVLTMGAVKKLGSDGKISVEIMQRAIKSVLPELEKAFKDLPVTVDGAMTRVKNAWLKAMGEMNQQSGLNKGLVEALKVIEDIIPAIRDEMVSAFIGVGKWIGENKTALGEVWLQVKGITEDVINLSSAISHAIGATVGLGNEFSVFGFALYSARLIIAGIQDGFVAIGGVVLKVGQIISNVIIGPVTLFVTTMLGVLTEHIGIIQRGIGKGLAAIGLEKIGTSIKSAGDSMQEFSLKLQSAKGAGFDLAKSLGEAGDKAFEFIASGDSVVQSLLKGEQQVSLEMVKQGKYKEGLIKQRKAENEESEKAVKAAQKLVKAAEEEHDKTIKAYREQVESLEALKQFGLDGDKRTTAQKEQIKLELLLAEATNESAKNSIKAALATNKVTQGLEAQEVALRDVLKAEKERLENINKDIEQANEEAQKNEDLVATFGMLKGAIEDLEITRLQEQLDQKLSIGLCTAETAALEELIDAKKRNAGARTQLGVLEEQKKASEEAQKEWEKTVDKIDDVFRNGFADMLNSGKSAWKSFTKSLATTFKTVVADEIYKTFFRKYVISFAGNMLGMFGMGSGATGAMEAVNSGSNLLNTGSTILNSGQNLASVGSALYNGYTAGGMAGVGNVMGQIGNYAATALSGGTAAVSTGAMGTGWVSAEMGAAYGSAAASGAAGAGAAGSAAGGAASSFAQAIPVIGWIIAGMLKNASLYDQGWDAQNGEMSNFGKTIPSVIVDKVLRKIGLSGKAASILSGSALVSRAFGRKNPEVNSFGIQGDFTDEGFAGGQNFQRWKAKGGWFRSDKEWTEYSAMDEEQAKSVFNHYKLMREGLTSFAETLGLNTEVIKGYTKGMVLDLTTDETKNMELLAGQLSIIGDELSEKLLPNFAEFAKANETAGEVLQRLATEYKSIDVILDSVGMTFGQVGMASLTARKHLLDLMGGVEGLSSGTAFFAQNFLTEAEQMEPAIKGVSKRMAELGHASVDTKDEFKNLVKGLNLASEADAKLFASLMEIAPAFATVADYATKAADEAIQKAKESSAAVEDARNNLSEAYERESSALENTIDKFKDFSKSLRSFRDSLLVGGLSNLSPEQKYLELKRRFESTSALAMSGDEGALSSLQGISEQFLEASKGYFASSMGYTEDFDLVRSAIERSANAADAQVSVDQASLDNLRKMVEGIITVNATLLSVKDALSAYRAVGGATSPTAPSTSSISAIPGAIESPRTGDSNTDFVTSVYNQYLGRTPDAGGMQHYTQALASGASVNDVIHSVMNSPEFKSRHGFAKGGNAEGWSWVGEQGPELAYFGDKAHIYTANQSQQMTSSGDEETKALLREAIVELRAANSQRGAATEAQLIAQRKLAEKIDQQKRVLAATNAD